MYLICLLSTPNERALANCASLGTTAERVIVAGDSAGGNLCVSVTLRCLLEGIRPPDGVVAFYPALLVERAFSPARVFSLADPLLNYVSASSFVLQGCVKEVLL